MDDIGLGLFEIGANSSESFTTQFAVAKLIDPYPGIHYRGDKLVFPWQEVGDLVFEPFSVPEVDCLGDQPLRAADPQSLDQDGYSVFVRHLLVDRLVNEAIHAVFERNLRFPSEQACGFLGRYVRWWHVAGPRFADFLADPSQIDSILADMQAQAEVILT